MNPLTALRRRVYLPYARIPPGRTVELPGRGSTYVTDTPGPDPEAPTIVLLHALGCTGLLTWFPAIEPLSRRFRVVTLDLRWHGQGIHRGDFSLVDCADDVGALIDVLIWTRCSSPATRWARSWPSGSGASTVPGSAAWSSAPPPTGSR